jgi:hypothetical protein
VDLGRKERGPAGLAIAGLFDEDEAGAEVEERGGLGVRTVGECEQDDVEFASELNEEIEDANGAAVRERVGIVRGEDSDAAAVFGARAAVEAADGVGGGRALAARKRPPAGTQEDAVEGDAAPEQNGGEVWAEMVAFEAPVVGENLARGEEERGAAERVRLASEQDGSESDAVMAERAFELGPVFRGGEEVAAVGNEGADLIEHAATEVGRTGGEGDDDGVGIFAEEAEEEKFEPLFHGRVRARTAEAMRGQSAARAVTGR